MMFRDERRSYMHYLRAIVAVVAVVLLLICWRALAAPTVVTSVTPTKGPSVGGESIIITGNGFTDYSSVAPINFSYSGTCQTYVAPASGSYRLETWGAQGGTAGSFAGGRGGYSVGTIRLNAGTTLYVCVGGQGQTSSRTTTAPFPGGFNGGGGSARSNNGNGKETASGGGATDIRVGVNSLFARVIVAGGGGGGIGQQLGGIPGGAGGGLAGMTMPNPGLVGHETPGQGGTQTAGGSNGIACAGGGTFGAGGIPCNIGVDDRSGGGGGWFGGGAGITGGGGSGFIFKNSSDVSAATIGGTYLLGGNYYLSSANTIAGSGSTMPAVSGGTQTGQLGNGYARITRLPYNVTVDGIGCDDIQILSGTQISCVTPAHSAAPVDIEVTIGESTGKLTDGYTYTDGLVITGPGQIMSRSGAEYEISLNYAYSGIVTLDDGGKGGTWSGINVINGNQIQFNNNSSVKVTYIPPTNEGGEITLTATSGVDYVTNASKNVTISASSYILTCFDVSTGLATSHPFVVPGTTLNCSITLDGPYAGTISLTDVISGTGGDRLGGEFTSTDVRFSGGTFTTTYADTGDSAGQVLAFFYTSPTWGQIMGEDLLYTGVTYYGLGSANRSNIFWPTLTATSLPVLTSAQNTVRLGLLAQAYEILSTDTPAIDAPGSNGCLGCRARFEISTYGAPYFGSITLSSDKDGTFSDGQVTIIFNLDGSGANRVFTYLPNELGGHTLTGVSSSPAITDDDITFNVLNSRITITCDPVALARGHTTDCVMHLVVTGVDVPGIDLTLEDIFMGSIEEDGVGVFVDTSDSSGNPSGTLVGDIFKFCGGSDNPLVTGEACDDPSETYTRTFTYTLPASTDASFSEVRIQGSSDEYIPAEVSWQVLRIIPDTMAIACTSAHPDCQTMRVADNQRLVIQPNGIFAGRVQLSDNAGGIFSGNGIVEWDYDGIATEFSYAPSSSGVKTITATVIEVRDDMSGIKVGDTYTFEIVVLANQITIFGPDFVSVGYVWDEYRFGITLNGPYVGEVTFSLWIRDGASEIMLQPDAFPLAGNNLVDNGDGTYTCTVTLAMYDEATNTTTACAADNGGVGAEYAGINYFEIRAVSEHDTYIANEVKVVGVVANDFMVLQNSVDATTDTIVTTVGTPLEFTLRPNALFAGVYSIDDSDATGHLVPSSIVARPSEWPATNNQAMQTRSVTFTPTTTGRMTLVFEANRDGTSTPDDPLDFGVEVVELIVLANSAEIIGPDTIINGGVGVYTLSIPGPFVGRFEIDETSTPDGVLNKLAPTYCDFDLNDWDEVTNTTSCTFTFTSNPNDYANYVYLYVTSGSISATKRFDLIADGYSITNNHTADPTDTSFNAKINNPITFTLTPNAEYDGEFVIVQNSAAGTLIGSPVDYSFADYAALAQRAPLSKTFTYTPTSFGQIILTIETGLGPQDITLNVFEWPVIGGPDTIVTGESSGEYTLTIHGAFDGPIDLTIWDSITGTQITGATIVTSHGGGSSCDFDASDMDLVTGLTSCTFTFNLPTTFTGNYVEIHSDDPDALHSGVEPDTHNVAVVANDFKVTPDTLQIAAIDDTLTFTITPNALYDGLFTFSTIGSGFFNESAVAFTHADWPVDQSPIGGKTFTFTPQSYGNNDIEVCGVGLGCVTIPVMVMADTMSVSGPATIQLDNTTMNGDYTLTIPGPYDGTVNFTIIDTATGLPIMSATFSGGGSCTFTAADYDSVAGTTSCTLTLDLPAPLTSTKHIRVTATTAPGDKLLPTTNTATAITASDYVLSPNTTQTVNVGDVITFTITPNAVANDSFGISTDGASTLSTAAVGFATSDYPLSSNLNVTKTFTVTTTTPGIETITVSSPLGNQTIEIVTLANGINIIGPDRIQQGTTSSTYTAVVNGPYDGTVSIDVVLPDGGVGSPAVGISLSTASCVLTLSHYDPITNTTKCSFTVSVPTAYSANWLSLAATSTSGLTSDNLIIALTADDFEFTANALTAETGTPVTFTVSPNSLFHGAFTLSDGDMAGLFGPTSLMFNDGSWPIVSLDQTTPSGLTFTYTPRKPGSITITACNANLSCREIIFLATGKDISTKTFDGKILPPDTGWFSGLASATVGGSGLAVVVSLMIVALVRKKTNFSLRQK